MKPQRPYLLRALYEWIVDSDEIPYVLVDAEVEGVQVPSEHVVDGQIVLNLSSNAVRDLSLGDEYVMCVSRFGGRSFELCLPILSIKAIYCKDSGQGMVFPEESALAEAATNAESSAVSDQGSAGSIGPVRDEQGGSDEDKDKPTLRLV
ncbi:MAG: ClpXP protease specificity-enhancing factor [Pseudomonadota bacterium]